MKKVIAVAYSDHHVHNFRRYNRKPFSRLHASLDLFRAVGYSARKYKVPILFAGDLVEDNEKIENRTLQYLIRSFTDHIAAYNIDYIAIDGNHDQCEQNTLTNRSPNYCSTMAMIFPNFKHLENNYIDIPGARVFGIPYLTRNEGFTETVEKLRGKLSKKTKNILLIHTDLHKVSYPNGFTPEEIPNLPKKLKRLFKGFDLVLSGHVHKKQKLYSWLYMMGAAQQQSQEESELKMGYWRIYDNMSLEFIETKYPKFVPLKEGEAEPNQYDYFYQVAPENEGDSDDNKVTQSFHSSDSPSRLVKKYLKATGVKDKRKKALLIKLIEDAHKDH